MPRKGLHLTKSDIKEVLIHIGLPNNRGVNFHRERIDDENVEVTFTNWSKVLQKIPQQELSEKRRFVKERIQAIAEAKFETAKMKFE